VTNAGEPPSPYAVPTLATAEMMLLLHLPLQRDRHRHGGTAAGDGVGGVECGCRLASARA